METLPEKENATLLSSMPKGMPSFRASKTAFTFTMFQGTDYKSCTDRESHSRGLLIFAGTAATALGRC